MMESLFSFDNIISELLIMFYCFMNYLILKSHLNFSELNAESVKRKNCCNELRDKNKSLKHLQQQSLVLQQTEVSCVDYTIYN